ncbi:hypothetical protein IJ732_01895 [bacterium]|nr:hypothetical protein [bacterium]
MITNAGMSNPIGAVKPNFGMYTLGKDNNILTKMFNGIASHTQDTVDRGAIPKGDIGKELSLKNFV